MAADPSASSMSTATIAILGSSGGNLLSQGGADPRSLLWAIVKQARAAGFHVCDVQFIGASSSMDGISPETPASLWQLGNDDVVPTFSGTLQEVNASATAIDAAIARKIAAGEITGLVIVSADPRGANSQALAAAAAAGIPVAGTGGSSIAQAQQLGVNLVSVSGTTGSTSTTRAVSYISGLARYWKVGYRPSLGSSSTESTSVDERPAWRRMSLRGIMVGSLPAFIAMALVLALSKIPLLEGLSPVFDALIAGLPIVIAAIAARKVSGLGEVGIVAGALAGILSQTGGIIGGLVGGILAGLLAAEFIKWTLRWRFPVTTANIVAGALAGLIPGLLVYFLLAPATAGLGNGVKSAIEWAVDFNPLLAGALGGLVMWPAIMGGVYHSVILPIVLLEMGEKGHSFFGAIDMVALVMVSFGITMANVIRPRTSGERALAGSGAIVNFFFGTFVEASYPFMFGDKKVFGIAILAATAGGTVVGIAGTEATAYLPAFVAPFISTNAVGMVLAMLASAGLAFALTFMANSLAIRAARSADATQTVES